MVSIIAHKQQSIERLFALFEVIGKSQGDKKWVMARPMSKKELNLTAHAVLNTMVKNWRMMKV